MGLLKKIFGDVKAQQSKPKIDWIPLNDLKQLDELIKRPGNKYQAIFKHSIRCGISSAVLRQFERQDLKDDIDFYYLDLLTYRAISDEVATRLGVIHQSPQLIVVKSGDVVAHASHYDIMGIKLN